MLMTTLIVRDVDDVRKAMNIIERFCKVFGAKVNIQKTGFMSIGNVGEKVQQFYYFKEEENMKILGILIEKNEKVARDLMWEEVVGKMERI